MYTQMRIRDSKIYNDVFEHCASPRTETTDSKPCSCKRLGFSTDVRFQEHIACLPCTMFFKPFITNHRHYFHHHQLRSTARGWGGGGGGSQLPFSEGETKQMTGASRDCTCRCAFSLVPSFSLHIARKENRRRVKFVQRTAPRGFLPTEQREQSNPVVRKSNEEIAEFAFCELLPSFRSSEERIPCSNK